MIIPALAESAYLPETLASLATNDADRLRVTLIVVVVNNPPPGAGRSCPGLEGDAGFADNQRTIKWLREFAHRSGLRLGWIDASSPGRELPAGAGVGMARKIGCDTALSLIAEARSKRGNTQCGPVVVFNLDADTVVLPDYLAAADELLQAGVPGGVLPFRHRPASTEAAQRAVDAYELFMYYCVEGLTWAMSPYAYHTVGSAMMCTAGGYVRAGGISAKRQGGEDFYFLQQLAKTGGVCRLRAATVFPSARPSARVPFGTGPRIARALATPDRDPQAFDPRVFRAVRKLFEAVSTGLTLNPRQVLEQLESAATADFLHRRGLLEVFPRFQRQFGAGAECLAAFHSWFDGLATFRLIKHLTQNVWPEQDLLSAWDELFRLQHRRRQVNGAADLLEWCRSQRGVGALPPGC